MSVIDTIKQLDELQKGLSIELWLAMSIVIWYTFVMKTPKTFSYSQQAREFWRWASENQPRHRELSYQFLPLKGHRPKIKKGTKISFWLKLLDFLVSKGWPEYAIVWTNNEELIIFDKYLLQDVKNEIQRNTIR